MRLRRFALPVALSCAALLPLAETGARADDGEREGPTGACVKVSTEARYRAYGYDHIVTLKNGCDKPMRCSVTTDVNPTPATVELDVGEEKSVLTYRGSPAREFSANADCKPQ